MDHTKNRLKCCNTSKLGGFLFEKSRHFPDIGTLSAVFGTKSALFGTLSPCMCARVLLIYYYIGEIRAVWSLPEQVFPAELAANCRTFP